MQQQDVESLLADLTEPQRAAATHVDGPLLIIAGAGSGKTRVITRRVAYLIAQGIEPAAILAITFTNKAAGEMKHRVGQVLGRQLHDFGKLDQRWPTICTFHSLCLRILRHYAPAIGLPSNFTIYDSGDQTKVIKDALKMLDISTTNFSPQSVHSAISNAKNQLLSAEDFARQAGDFYQRQVAKIYSKYQQMLKANNALDFDDLLLRTTDVYRAHPEILAELQERFKYIMIDEYQDTNHAQYVLAHALAMKYRNMCVVGDPDQSIYAWRGADIKNILDFEQDYPDAKIVRLEQNYRSTKTILAIASKLIANNTQRKDKTLWTENPEGDRAKVVICQDEYDEAAVVTRQLQEWHESGHDWSQMAIFYRMNALSRVMEDGLRRANVPYQIARGVEFYNRKEIKDVLAYLRVIANPDDEVSLTRILNVPTRGLGDQSVHQMQTFAIANGISLWQALGRVGEIQGVSARAANSARQFVALVEQWRQLAVGSRGTDDIFADKKGIVQTLMEDVFRRSGMEAALKKAHAGEETGEGAIENVEQLISSASEYDGGNPEGSLDEYLSMISLVSDSDHLKEGGAVTLMTLHAAKGLEFPVVAMIGMEEGVLPHSRSRGNPVELEEERRLCFVGITRAQERLLMTKAAYRTMRGLRERTVTSPFLSEMPQESLEVTDRAGQSYGSRPSFGSSQLARETSGGRFRKGQLVRHPTFGLGRIADINDMGPQTRAIVEFSSAGRKTLILEHARLEAAG
jgi:DNA helicase-2/ATP-dependent DNA helicase PcrA